MDNKYDREAAEFKKNFIDFQNKKIVLYGTGRMTMTLLERVKEFNIIGLLDREESLIGQVKYGMKILSRQEAEENADIVIINTAECYWHTIYCRIQDWKIPIYTRDGKIASSDIEETQRYSDYWNENVGHLENEINKYEVVSFDIFDTLVMRRIHNPNDVFKLVELKLKKEFGEEFSYVDLRNQAITFLEEPTLNEIFDKIKDLTGWSEKRVERIKQCEMSIDTQLITARKEMVDICNKTIETKEVYFVSDMYYTADILFKILQENGVYIKEKEKIIVSCNHRMSKQQGRLWEFYSENIVCGRKALHIGDNIKADVEKPRSYGLDTYMVMSASNMMQYSSLGKIVPAIQSVEASLYVGILMEKIFNSPFALYRTKGKVNFSSDKEVGYCLLGGIVYTFTMWLIQNARNDGVEQLVFLSRDGYFLIRAYEYICELLHISVPEPIYLEISRRAMIVPMLKSKEDIMEEVDRLGKYNGTVSEFMYDRFGMEISDDDIEQADMKELLEIYANAILDKAQKEREGYLEYCYTLNIEDNFAIVDTGYYGSIQYMLGKLLKKKTRGYYFQADLSSDNKYYKNNMKGCFQKVSDKKGVNTQIYKKIQFIESFFTAPCGMLLYINENGEKIYDVTMENQKHFDVREEMFMGIVDFVKDMIRLKDEVGINQYINDALFVDEAFGRMLENGFVITERMKDGFYFNDTLQSRREIPLWK